MVTGSKYWLSIESKHYLVDCGVFQGPPELEQLNWDRLPIAPAQLEAVLLTHAHIDHSGYLPKLVADGFSGPVYASEATCALLELLLPDSGYLQEEQASYANKKGYSRHKPARPLYTYDQAVDSLKSLRPIRLGQIIEIDEHLGVAMHRAGHILGSTILECDVSASTRQLKLVFSGDLGRYDQEVMKSPASVAQADYLFVESTYGDRAHSRERLEDQLAAVVTAAANRGGALLIPSFAVGRTQQVLYYLRKLQDQKRIPEMPVYMDSPMAIDATEIYCRFGNEHNLNVNLLMDDKQCPLRCHETHFARTVEESKRLNELPGPIIIISASGMCNGGRIVHHLKHRLPDPRNTVLFVGFQGRGTRGRMLRDGATKIQIHGQPVQVRAHIAAMDGLSAHADYHEILRWLSGFKQPPKQTFIMHGEPEASLSLKTKIEQQFGWSTRPPKYLERVMLGEAS